jgi:RNA polymerase sigma-70 factor (ECF subfamily)
LKNNEEANDVVQSVFARLWEKQHNVIFEEGINAYLYKSVYNLCLNHIRKTRTTKDYILHAVKDPAYTIQSSPENQALAAELSGRITTAINELPTQCRLIFLMSREKEKKYTEIAQELDISVKTVEAQMTKALRLLRERLADCLARNN